MGSSQYLFDRTSLLPSLLHTSHQTLWLDHCDEECYSPNMNIPHVYNFFSTDKIWGLISPDQCTNYQISWWIYCLRRPWQAQFHGIHCGAMEWNDCASQWNTECIAVACSEWGMIQDNIPSDWINITNCEMDFPQFISSSSFSAKLPGRRRQY